MILSITFLVQTPSLAMGQMVIASIAFLDLTLAMSRMMIASVAFLGRTLAMNQISHQRSPTWRKCRFPRRCTKLLR